MNIEHLREFVTLAECLNFSRAAEQLFCSQPALSKHITAMESKLGVKLFERSHEKVELTPYGSAFRDDAKRVLRDYDNALQRIQKLKKMKPMKLTVSGFTPYYKPFDDQLRKVKKDLKRRNPLLDLNVKMIDSDPVSQVRRGLTDISVLTLTKSFKADDLVTIPLFDDPLSAVVRSTHRLARNETVSIADIVDSDTIHLPASSAYTESRNAIVELLHTHNVHPLIIEHDWSTTEMFDYDFSNGIYITATGAANSLSIATDADTYRTIRFSDADMVACCQLIYRKDTDNAACAMFAKALASQIANVDMTRYW